MSNRHAIVRRTRERTILRWRDHPQPKVSEKDLAKQVAERIAKNIEAAALAGTPAIAVD
jgi:hypothetical protein